MNNICIQTRKFLTNMATKYTKEELEKMSRSEMAHYMGEITQTDICKDKNYCKLILNIWLKK